ncbi:hypothetical protein SAZ10_00590 [Mesorhizobium sp. BAC0120]|uniref:hypothetical protein n=1 Tax=Mesorhizobium sp. BAC0120 TaxID=3090670 RepID=UPI00298C5CD0|nr:hypothetical protein [Mesorhizobium sp. BAC0120]MDW6020253.1 hypothetical protein [Mesorhizobium sp. BAC0120]
MFDGLFGREYLYGLLKGQAENDLRGLGEAATDLGKSAGAGVRTAAEQTVGMPGDLSLLGGYLTSWAAEKLGVPKPLLEKVGDRLSSFRPPTSDEINELTTRYLGPTYQPTTDLGRTTKAVAEWAPLLLQPELLPGKAVGKIAGEAGEKIAAKLAGQRLANLRNNRSAISPFPKETRLFKDDYPGVVPADEKGKLLYDLDGRPFNADAEYVVGRRVAGGEDVPLPEEAIDEITKKIMGKEIEYDPKDLAKGETGFVKLDKTGKPTQVVVDPRLPADELLETKAHEFGHVVEITAKGRKGLPTYNRRPELHRNYSTGIDGEIRNENLISPKQYGYIGQSRDRELWADAFRAYALSPSYFKNRFPDLAREIREAVNTHPEFKNLLQFNSIAAAMAPVGLLGYLASQLGDPRPKSAPRKIMNL